MHYKVQSNKNINIYVDIIAEYGELRSNYVVSFFAMTQQSAKLFLTLFILFTQLIVIDIKPLTKLFVIACRFVIAAH